MNSKILIAGIGNIFLGDDGFGVEVVQRLRILEWPDGVTVIDFGIRGLDLCYALMEDFDAFVLIDAVPRGEAPGTLYTIEIDLDTVGEAAEPSLEPHALDPLRVLQAVSAMGGNPKRVLLVGCEPESLDEIDQFQGRMGLSPRVQAALQEAVEMVRIAVNSIQMVEA